ncbi:MAG: FctA domain-containing protein, partial [Saccharofermentanales bacterium]
EVEAVVFNNDYLAADVDVDLGGTKVLEGRELIDGEFEFNLYESDESASTGALLETVSNMGSYFDFSTITFSDGEEGIYLYLIKEVAAMLGGVSYDFTEYLVQVEITDDGEGNLVAEVRYLTLDETETWRDVEAVVFNNDYLAADVEVEIGGMKTLEGRDLIDGEFEFALYEFSESGNDALIETVSNVGPVFNFSPITFADGDEGYYYYLIKEVVGTLDGVMYDLTEYMVEVIITDNGEGQLEAEVSFWIVDETQEEWIAVEAVVFSNRYINPELEVEKMVEETSFSEVGDELHYSFEVTNTGNLAFIKLTVNDPRLGIVDLVIDLTDPLLPGESYIHEFTVPYVVTEEDVEAAAPIINTLTVVGETEEGFEDEDEDDVIVPFEQIDPIIPPILALEKLAHEKNFAKAGDLIHYYFELTNEGIVPIVKLTVNDPKLGIEDLVIDLADDLLMPGDTLTYEFAEAYVVTEADVAAGKVENVLTVIGESPDGAEDEVTDDLVVPMEKILPHVPSTGEYISRWTAIGALILGGAVALILINRRRKLNQS